MRKKLAWVLGGIGAVIGLFLLASPGCACLTPEQLARVRLRGAVEQAIAAQRTHFDSTGRFAGTLDSLGAPLSFDSRITLTLLSDSAYLLVGTDAGLTCRFEGHPALPREVHPTCVED